MTIFLFGKNSVSLKRLQWDQKLLIILLTLSEEE